MKGLFLSLQKNQQKKVQLNRQLEPRNIERKFSGIVIPLEIQRGPFSWGASFFIGDLMKVINGGDSKASNAFKLKEKSRPDIKWLKIFLLALWALYCVVMVLYFFRPNESNKFIMVSVKDLVILFGPFILGMIAGKRR